MRIENSTPAAGARRQLTPTRLAVIALLALTGLVTGVLLARAGVSVAATQEDHTQFSVTAGSLSFSTAPALPTLGTVTLTGAPQTTNATMTNFAVDDATGSGAGWNVTVEGQSGTGKSAVFAQYCPKATCGSTPEGYVAAGSTLPADSLALSSTGASFTAQNGTTGTAPGLQCSTPCAVDSPTAVKIASAALGTGMGTWQGGGFSSSSLALSTPSTLRVLPSEEIYRVNLLWTLSTGP
jgi:hypothetical protein